MKKLTCLALVVLLLSACGGPEPQPTDPPTEPVDQPTPTAPDLRGQFASWSAGAATLNAVLYGAAGSETEVATGEVSADGKLEIFLNKDVPDDFLTQLAACEGLTQSNPDTRQNTFSALSVSQGMTVIGRTALVSSRAVLSEGLQTVGDYYVQQTYADANSAVTGSCTLGGTVNAVFEYNLKLNRGWNAVTFELVSKTGEMQTLELTSGTPQGAAWFFAPAP